MRPELNNKTKADTFIEYYWLKEELISFCKEYGLPSGGGKKEITDRIYSFLKDGTVLHIEKTKGTNSKADSTSITLDKQIPKGYRNDEKHREFFKTVIGSGFRFNVQFMNWMKANAGKTYSDAVKEYKRIIEEKKGGITTEISPQFEYNQYTRDIFKANPGLPRESAIICWKYKKSLAGHNRYEDKDLIALKNVR